MQKNYKVNQFYLDNFQMQLLNSDNNALVIAGAGSGKTLTIIGKIKYLIEVKKILPSQILIISFTNNSVNDIKSKLNIDIDVFTFHKLSIEILKKQNIQYKICDTNLLSYIVQEFLYTCEKQTQKTILKFLNLNINYCQFINSKFFTSFCNFIVTFINLWKTNNFKYSDIQINRYNNLELKILLIIFNIYKIYIEEKNGTYTYDFDDLIIEATKNAYNFGYKYIIIDEFQDTSQIRLNLIKKMSEINNSKVIVVGDDWQSIYKFSGCDLNLFLEFQKYFSDVDIIKLINTYRNSQELINIASKFITKNPKQIIKELKSFNHSSNPIIFDPITNKIVNFKKILNYYSTLSDDIMILSRNNNDIYEYIDTSFQYKDNILYYNNKTYKYYTVHKSKGLESEYVIIINLDNSYLGFPNKIESNPLIDKLSKDKEIKYAEERRLFYVAITRCKKQTTLLYDAKAPSVFIKEIKKIVKKEMGKISYFK